MGSVPAWIKGYNKFNALVVIQFAQFELLQMTPCPPSTRCKKRIS